MNTVLCPRHQTPLFGGPVLFQCATDGGHVVRAADVDHEYHAPEAVAL